MAKKSKNKTVKKPVDKKPTENPATIVKPANAADETPIEEIVAEEMPASDTQASEKPDTAPKENPADKTPTPKKEEKPAIGFFGLTTMQQKADADGVRGGKNKWI